MSKATFRFQRDPMRCLLILAAVTAWMVPSKTLADGDQKVEPVVVIVQAKSGVDKLSLNDLRRYWMSERQSWGSANRVVLYMPAGGHAREIVLKKIYQMTEGQYKQFWIAKVFRSEAQSDPKIVSTTRSAVEQVSKTAGAMSCVEAENIPKTVRILSIDGHLPGEKGYPLQ